jgi:hypothetical protein
MCCRPEQRRHLFEGIERAVAKTEEGKKFVVVAGYQRRGPGGKVITVQRHDRSTPCAPSKGRVRADRKPS